MEFIKNIYKEFDLSTNYDFIKKTYNLNIAIKPEVKVKVDDIDIDGVTFAISKISDTTDLIIKELIFEKIKKVGRTKKVLNKILNEWNNNPQNFIKQEFAYCDKNIYLNKNLLTKKEYNEDTYTFFGKYINYYDLSFSTGRGEFTYLDKEYYETRLNGIDKWLEDTIKEFNSTKFKTKILNTLNKTKFSLSYKEVIKYISVPLKETKIVKPTFVQLDEVDCDYNDIYDEHGNIDLGWVHKYICDLELDEVSWDDETGDIDNELPYRITINTNSKSHIFEFLVKQGNCIEATWEHRIWDAKITNLKQII